MNGGPEWVWWEKVTNRPTYTAFVFELFSTVRAIAKYYSRCSIVHITYHAIDTIFVWLHIHKLQTKIVLFDELQSIEYLVEQVLTSRVSLNKLSTPSLCNHRPPSPHPWSAWHVPALSTCPISTTNSILHHHHYYRDTLEQCIGPMCRSMKFISLTSNSKSYCVLSRKNTVQTSDRCSCMSTGSRPSDSRTL